ncbi:Maf-like protein [Actinoplanes lobatus]|uniref:Nucleoside triphosphate pyrophosphatase n=1 Tax=Actinoplanes lobatus TaxID=113568 RepID=A0A7W7HAT3_9ACTN|nr:nucleoside triphosphate pyrophosphatase [Actinoplanes lobatus]MBB4747148.1 septum formation protein [Actinoplanes lobatus]GGN55940.1 Maf-like protein [Actinoplanes lobatus]GIE39284.1 Maf-like protein [Actinoplanes lobatus]
MQSVQSVQTDIVYRLVLASASPARRALLTGAGIDAEVVVSGVDESAVEADDAYSTSLALARMKARTVAAVLPADPGALVLGCDSVLAFDGEVLGKPADAEEAAKRWMAMRGRSGVLHTGHHLTGLVSGRQAEAVGTTTVHFADVSDAEIEAYVASGEPLHVAGAFTLDGRGGAFVERIEGDPGNVIGLSLPLLRRLLAEMGVPITSLWRH